MPELRRRIIRPSTSTITPDHQRRLDKLREQLDHERTALARWQTRLKRAFNACQKHQDKIARIEKTIARLED